ncbi:hypothetical protein PIB30_096987, partial [Stylosanthes scabra]|nr:hypothetical protein [Stylosanthes scabra]
MEIDTMDALLAQNKAITQQLSTLNKKMEKLEVAAMGTQVETKTTCGLCGDAHENQNCSLLSDETPLEQTNYMGNQPRQPYDPNSNTYNPALEKLTLTTAGFVQSTNQFIEEARANFRNQESSIRKLERL